MLSNFVESGIVKDATEKRDNSWMEDNIFISIYHAFL